MKTSARGDEALDGVAARVGLEVDRQRLLAAVEPGEVGAGAVHDVVVLAREVAAVGPLDLDHARAEVGEVAAGERDGDRLLDGHHRQSFERLHVTIEHVA